MPARRQEKNCTGKYSKGLTNQNGEDPVNLCESNNLERSKLEVTFPGY